MFKLTHKNKANPNNYTSHSPIKRTKIQDSDNTSIGEIWKTELSDTADEV